MEILPYDKPDGLILNQRIINNTEVLKDSPYPTYNETIRVIKLINQQKGVFQFLLKKTFIFLLLITKLLVYFC